MSLGKGVAIIPNEGKLYAPCNAEVTALMGHAIGLLCENGAELLIHIGIDTVELNGKHYNPHVTESSKVSAGDLLIEFNKNEIEKAGYRTITPVVITNSDDYADIEVALGDVKPCQNKVLTLK